MNKLTVVLLASLSFATLATAHAASAPKNCAQLKDEHNLIYAAQGFCFKEEAAKQLYNADCTTTRPKFSEKQQKRLDDIEAAQKELQCK